MDEAAMTRIAVLEERSKRIEQKVDRAANVLEGTGQPGSGLTHKVSRLEMTMDAIKSRLGYLVGIGTTIMIALLTHAVLTIFGVI